MFSKKNILVSAIIVLIAINATAYAQSKVVVIPLLGDESPTPVPDSKIVFISAEQPNANFGGVVGADQICQNEAAAPGAHSSLGGKVFKAWLVDSLTDTVRGDGPTGTRSLNVPAGDLVSPSGQTLDNRLSNFFKVGHGVFDLNVNCDTSSFESCVESYNDAYLLEKATGSGALIPFGDVILGIPLPGTITSQGTNRSTNCEDYSNVGSSPAHSFAQFSLFIDTDLIIGTIINQARLIHSNCSSNTSFLCVEQ